MDDFLKGALEISKAQAGVRVMSAEEITAYVQKVAVSIRAVAMGEAACEPDFDGVVLEARKSIKEKSVTCLECGKSFKILTKRHLATHGLTTEEYLEKWGFKKGAPLACKALQRERRKKMGSSGFSVGSPCQELAG